MEAGRELDALVAEKVMGFPSTESPFKSPDSLSKAIYVMGPNGKFICPRYSTDIAAAWFVAQKIADMDDDHEIEIYLSPSKLNECEVGVRFWDRSNPDDPILVGPKYVLGKTAPHAICLAALKAIGHAIQPEPPR